MSSIITEERLGNQTQESTVRNRELHTLWHDRTDMHAGEERNPRDHHDAQFKPFEVPNT